MIKQQVTNSILLYIDHSRGFGFVTLEDFTKTEEILRSQPHLINGRKIDCKLAIPKDLIALSGMSQGKSKGEKKKKKKSYKSNIKNKEQMKNQKSKMTLDENSPLYMRKMFVGGLPTILTKEELIRYFSQFGKVERGIIMTDKLTGKSRGFGFIIFSHKETLDNIMNMSNCHFLCGKWIECKRAMPKEQMNQITENNIQNTNDNTSENTIKPTHNLFTYQNYIPKTEFKNFMQKPQNSINKNNQSNSSSNSTESSNKQNPSTNNQNIKSNTFQYYFNNCISTAQPYNYFHYKLFDSKGDELTKLKLYQNSNKIKVFTEDPDNTYDYNPFSYSNTNFNYNPEYRKNTQRGYEEYNDNEVDVSSEYTEEDREEMANYFGPNRGISRHKESINSFDSYRPY